MQYIIKMVAPTNVCDFFFKLAVLLLVCGFLNHVRDIALNGALAADSYWGNFSDASWTALPMCTSALFLIKHLNHLQHRLYEQATTDQLTQIPNRRWFMQKCGSELKADQILVLLDVDHFKSINDQYGHDCGDICLVAVANHIKDALPATARCARLGGEEFGVLFEQTSLSDCENAAEKMCEGVDFAVPGRGSVRITLSAGVFQPIQHIEIGKAFGLVDRALYQSKASGRGRYSHAKPGCCESQPLTEHFRRSALA